MKCGQSRISLYWQNWHMPRAPRFRAPPGENRLPHDSKIANIGGLMKQEYMTTLIKFKLIQGQCITSLQSGVHSKLVIPVEI